VITLAVVAVIAVGGAAVLGVVLYERGQPPGSARGPVATPAAAGKAISPPNVGSSEEFDRANAVGVVQKNHPAIEACAAKSRRFNGTIEVLLDVSTKDGRVTGTDCSTVYPSHDSKHPKLDPEAAELCACIQSVTPSWKFKPPKSDVPIPFDDSEWLRVKYVCSR
jgi:hypothetical protein